MKEREENMVTITELEPGIMEEILSYMYTGVVNITEENSLDLAVAADYFMLASLREECSDFLKTSLSPDVCLAVLAIAEKFSFQDLRDRAQLYTLKYFGPVAKTDEFLHLSVEQLLAVISSDHLVAREEEVYESLIKWTKNDLETRKQHFARLFHHVRLIYLARFYLLNNVEGECLVSDDPECKCLVDAAKDFFSPGQPAKTERVNVPRPRMCQNGILVAGGYQEDCTLTASVKLYVPTLDKCFELCPMITPRKNHGVSKCEGSVYVVGGSSRADPCVRSVEVFDPTTSSWSSARSLPVEVTGVSVVTLGSYLYAVGGSDNNGQPISTVQRYSPRLNKWQYVTPMNYSRTRHSVVASTYLYAFGGYGGVDYAPVKTAEMYDPSSNSWININPMLQRRSDACAACIGHKIYIIGGEDVLQTTIKLGVCEIYEPAVNAWSSMKPLLSPRCSAGAAVIGNKIYVLGGIGEDGQETQKIECYDSEEEKWEIVSKLPAGVEGLASCAITVPGELMQQLARTFKDHWALGMKII